MINIRSKNDNNDTATPASEETLIGFVDVGSDPDRDKHFPVT